MANRPRLLFVLLALLLASPFVLPLWHTKMEAPQYKGDEALEVSVYAGRVAGDLDEIENLNQYVGVRLPLDGPELRLVPVVFGVLCGLALAASLTPARWHRALATGLLALLLAVSVAGLGVLQLRLYQMGHDRGEQIMEGVPDFTPPVLGHIHVANFDASTRLGAGGWLLATAIALCAAMVFRLLPANRRHLAPTPAGESARTTGETA